MATVQSVPMYFPTAFNLTDAQTCADMVNAAYQQFDQFMAQSAPQPLDFQWAYPTTISNPLPIWWIQKDVASEPIGFLATDGNGNAYLVFRGTMSTIDKVMDADFGQTEYDLVTDFGNVDKGYYQIYTNLTLPTAPTGSTTTLLEAIDALTGISTFFFTGHSLGAGLSSLAVPDVSTNSSLTPPSVAMYHYNFGSPRVGDTSFAAAMNFNTTIPTYRVVNTEDLVPIAPPPVSATGPMLYQHIGTPVDFTANYGSATSNHSMLNTYTYAVSTPSDPYNNNPSSSGADVADGTGALSRLVLVAPALVATPAS